MQYFVLLVCLLAEMCTEVDSFHISLCDSCAVFANVKHVFKNLIEKVGNNRIHLAVLVQPNRAFQFGFKVLLSFRWVAVAQIAL